MATQSGKLEIVDGPGRWDMMLAVFNGEGIYFEWGGTAEIQFNIERLWCASEPMPGLEISGISFHNNRARSQCSFTAMFPNGKGAKTAVTGEYNLGTRKGTIDLTPLCEIGALPWPESQ